MNNIIHILITGAGSPGIDGTIFSLKNNPDNKKFKIITTDINPNAVGQYISDKFYILPKPENPNYINEIIKIITKEKVNVI